MHIVVNIRSFFLENYALMIMNRIVNELGKMKESCGVSMVTFFGDVITMTSLK